MIPPTPQAPAAVAASIEQLAEFVPVALFRYRVQTDGSDRIEHMSPGCFDLWEVTAHDILQDPGLLWGMVDPRDLPGFLASVAESGKQLTDWSYQWRITTPSGKLKWLHGVGRPRPEESGSVLWHSIILDVTNSQQAQEVKFEGEQRFRQLLDAVPNVAVQGYDDQLICRYWNHASEKLYGWSEQEAIGRSLLDLIIDEAMHDPVRQAVQTMIESGEAIPAEEMLLKRKDGTAVPVYSSHVLLTHAGRQAEFFCFDFDLSERQLAENTRLQLQSQLRESQKMEALGVLAGGVAHDFNNIVAAILGNVELALGDVPEANPARRSLSEIRKAGRRARDLVKQILAFSRRQDNTRQAICLRAVLEEAHGLLRAALPADVSLHLHVDPNLPAVLGNATQIEQVVLNLATNALQAVQGRAGASVQLRLERVEHLGLPDTLGREDEFEILPVSDAWPGVGVCMKVIDNGHGMPPETLKRVFEPFFTTKAPGAGTGLGLAVVHGILREHGAALRVRSQPGSGTAFTAIFPGLMDASPEEPLPMETAQPARPWGDALPPHVLYVDDDEAIAFLVRRLLERAGYRVSAYTQAQDALTALSNGPLDVALCITDFNMPGMSGLRLAREIKALHPNLPVAIASGYISEELRQQAPEAGVDEVIYKPDTVEGLCSAIERLLKR